MIIIDAGGYRVDKIISATACHFRVGPCFIQDDCIQGGHAPGTSMVIDW